MGFRNSTPGNVKIVLEVQESCMYLWDSLLDLVVRMRITSGICGFPRDFLQGALVRVYYWF